MSKWNYCKLGDVATLEYGKALKDYKDKDGKYDVFGTNGKIAWVWKTAKKDILMK